MNFRSDCHDVRLGLLESKSNLLKLFILGRFLHPLVDMGTVGMEFCETNLHLLHALFHTLEVRSSVGGVCLELLLEACAEIFRQLLCQRVIVLAWSCSSAKGHMLGPRIMLRLQPRVSGGTGRSCFLRSKMVLCPLGCDDGRLSLWLGFVLEEVD